MEVIKTCDNCKHLSDLSNYCDDCVGKFDAPKFESRFEPKEKSEMEIKKQEVNNTEFKKNLARNIRDVGEFLIKNADDIAGDIKCMNGLDIRVEFNDYDGMFHLVPVITIEHRYFPKRSIDRVE